MNTFPILIGALCVYAIAYRYYSAVIAAKALALDDRRVKPAHQFRDGHNFIASPKWVLFGHQFAAIAARDPWWVPRWPRSSVSPPEYFGCWWARCWPDACRISPCWWRRCATAAARWPISPARRSAHSPAW